MDGRPGLCLLPELPLADRLLEFTSELAVLVHLACPVCGATRRLEKFGITGEAEFDDGNAPEYDRKIAVQETGGGYRAIRWTHHAPSHEMLRALRDRLDSELASLDAALAGEGSRRVGCVACGYMAPPWSDLGDPEFDPEDSPRRHIVQVVQDDGESRPTWVTGGMDVDVARAVLARLRAEAQRLEEALLEVGE
jgi:sarcosine oxidase delta subunit